jgi:hypothetical protein
MEITMLKAVIGALSFVSAIVLVVWIVVVVFNVTKPAASAVVEPHDKPSVAMTKTAEMIAQTSKHKHHQ